MAAATFVIVIVSAGVRASPGVLILPLEREFGWTRAEISGAVAVSLFLYGLLGPFSAAYIDRYGLRRVITGALVLLTLAVGLSAMMESLWQMFVLWGVLVGIGAGMTATVLAALVANRWFQQRRGFVLGSLTAAAAAGQLIFLPSLAWFLDAVGWRPAVLTMAALLAGVTFIGFLFLRDRPQDMGLGRYGESLAETNATVSSQRPAGNPFINTFRVLGICMKSRDFWILGGSFFICGLSTNGLIGTHMVASCFDAGIPEVQAAGLLAFMAVFNFIGTAGSGFLSDKFDSRKLLFWFYALRGLALMWLPMSGYSFYGLALFAIFFGLDWIATVPPTVRLISDAVGRERGAMAYGWLLVIHQLGAATAAFGAGVMRENLGDYFLSFMLIGATCLVAAVAVLTVGRGKKEGTLKPAMA